MFEGSNPSLSTIYGSVAQVVEQETENLRVGSASLSRTTKITCSSGGIGRRTGLKIPGLNKACGFESHLEHHHSDIA